jgi:parallel beta-helix repeat protein
MSARVGRRMLTFAAALVIAATALMMLGSAQVRADQVTRGETITHDTTLQNDLTDCPGDGIIVGADDITLDLNGHTIAGRFDVRFCTDECVHQDGIANTGHDRVVIENGEVRNFETELRLEGANRNKLIALQVHRDVYPNQPPYNVPSIGIYMSHSERNEVLRTTVGGGDPALLLSASDRNTISDSSIFGSIARDAGDGIHLVEGSDRNRLTHSSFEGNAQGFVIENSRRNVLEANDAAGYVGNMLFRAERSVIVGNTLVAGRSGDDLGLDESDGNVVRNNTVSFCAYGNGIGLYESDRNVVQGNAVSSCSINVLGSQNVIRANNVRGAAGCCGGDGLRIEPGSTSTLVEDNVVIGAYDDGIGIEAPGTLVRGNTANYNYDFGIEAVEGVIDGGGNRAFGNGNPLQCLNIVCN